MLHIYFLLSYVLGQMTVLTEEQRWIKIPCHANIEQGVKYRRITWYKAEDGSDVLTVLVSKDLLKNTTAYYKFANHSYEVGENNSLLIPTTAEKHCGIYKCTLWPPVGHYIQKANTEYYSAGCIKPQVQAVSSKKDALPANHHIKFIIPSVIMACAIIMFLIIKMTKNAKGKDIM